MATGSRHQTNETHYSPTQLACPLLYLLYLLLYLLFFIFFTPDVDFILAAAAIEYSLILISNDNIFLKIQETFPELQVGNWARI